jgi:hypothetical protein
MIRTFFALLSLLAASGAAVAQTAEIQQKIDKRLETIRQALKNSPEVRIADAQLRQAEANMHAAQLKVTTEVSHLMDAIEGAKLRVEAAERKFARIKFLHEQKAVDAALLDEAEEVVRKAQHELTVAERQLALMVGQGLPGAATTPAAADPAALGKRINKLIEDPDFAQTWRRAFLDILGRPPTPEELKGIATLNDDGARYLLITKMAKAPPASQPVPQELEEQLRAALDNSRVDGLKNASKQPGQLFDLARDRLKGINLHVRGDFGDQYHKIDFANPIPLRAYLQLLEDELKCKFILRNYGVVAVPVADGLPPGQPRYVLDVGNER